MKQKEMLSTGVPYVAPATGVVEVRTPGPILTSYSIKDITEENDNWD